MIEIWKDIKGFEGKFQVSNLGRVKRLHYITYSDNKFRHKYENEEKILEPFTWQSRYLRVDFRYSENKVMHRKATYIHNIVAETFLGERPLGYEIDHINGNYLDNRADNLRYVTRKENMNNPNNKPGNKGKKLTDAEKEYISKRTKEAMSNPEIRKKLHKKHNMSERGSKVLSDNMKKVNIKRNKN